MVDDGWRWCITVSFILISSHSIQEWLVTFSLCLADLIRWSHHLFLGRLVDIVFSARWDWSVRALDDVSRERSFDTVDTHLLSLRAQVDNCSKRHSFCFALLFKPHGWVWHQTTLLGMTIVYHHGWWAISVSRGDPGFAFGILTLHFLAPGTLV